MTDEQTDDRTIPELVLFEAGLAARWGLQPHDHTLTLPLDEE